MGILKFCVDNLALLTKQKQDAHQVCIGAGRVRADPPSSVVLKQSTCTHMIGLEPCPSIRPSTNMLCLSSLVYCRKGMDLERPTLKANC
eukprot:6492258-Amphidinium_carterae.1